MTDYRQAFERLRHVSSQAVKAYSLSHRLPEEFYKALKEYVDNLQQELKDTYIVIASKGIAVKRGDLYDYCLKNPEFAYMYAKTLSSL